MNLSAQEQALLNTDFGEDMEKSAAERVSACNEAYAYGFAKLAAEAADAKDEEDKEEERKEEKKEKMDEESEKAAAELGAFIERGFFDGLRKEGSDRHGDELYYIEPLILDKIAAAKGKATAAAAKRLMDHLRSAGSKVTDAAGKAKDSVVNYHKGMAQDARFGAAALKGAITGKTRVGALNKGERMEHLREGAKSLGKAGLKASPYAAVGAGGIYAATRKGDNE